MPAEIVQLHPDKTADIAGQIRGGLMRPAGQKELPTMLLYDERGLRLYDDITTKAPEYYLFGAEEEILKHKADEIVRAMHQGEKQVPTDEVVLELGAGALRKTSHILAGLSRLVPEAGVRAPITYYALDLEEREIERTLGEISASDIGAALHGRVETKGICGTYDDGLKLVQEGGLNTHRSPVPSLAFANGAGLGDLSPISSDSSSPVTSSGGSEASPPSTPGDPKLPLHILFLGSSLGNFPRDEQATFLRSLPLRAGVGDTLLLGMDHDNDKAVIEEAYNDPKGYTRNFIMNGLRAAGRALGNEQLFDESKWEYINHYNVARQHEAFFKSKCAQTVHDALNAKDISFLEGEVLKIEQSYKFSENDAFSLLIESNLRPIQRWTDSSQKYSLWLLERPPFSFPLLKAPSETSTPFGVPSMQDWEQVWLLWDCITRQMIPPSMLYQKPIDLRHICLFYLGHIPTFLDIHLSRLLNEPHTEPQEYKYIFERGIDPHVEDSTQICHSHSDVPKKDEDWPTPTAIAQYQTRVRARLRNLYDEIAAKKVPMTRKIARVLFMTLEHEALHAETLLYMLIQRAGTGTLPPPGFAVPPWTSLAATWDSAPQPKTKTVPLGPALVTLGHDDAEADDTDPVLATKVDGHEFGWDNEHPKRTVQVAKFEIEWRPVTNGQFYEFYTGAGKGKVQLPASWVDEGGEIRVRTLYGPVPLKTAHQWPVITSYHNLSTYATVKGGRLPTEPELRLFYEKFESGYEGGANIGFRNWHPVPATTGGERTAGKGSNGGVWEWTSTSFDKYDGFVPSKLYPGYSMDFFDGIHQVVLGGSYATIPRIAERKTFRNWYQSNYPYPWVGGRVAYDVAQ